MMKSFEDFDIKEIYGIPSGQVIEVSETELESLKKMNLVRFITFTDVLDDWIPVYDNCFEDDDYDKIIDILSNQLFQ